MVFLKIKPLTQQDFQKLQSSWNEELKEANKNLSYHPKLFLGYGLAAEDFILGGEEMVYWEIILDLENQEVYDLPFDEENPPLTSQEKLDQYEIVAYDDVEEDTINWYGE